MMATVGPSPSLRHQAFDLQGAFPPLDAHVFGPRQQQVAIGLVALPPCPLDGTNVVRTGEWGMLSEPGRYRVTIAVVRVEEPANLET